MKNKLKIKIRLMVNDIFQDIDNEAKIDTQTANAICEIHTNKIYDFITKPIEKLDTGEGDLFNKTIRKDLIKLLERIWRNRV